MMSETYQYLPENFHVHGSHVFVVHLVMDMPSYMFHTQNAFPYVACDELTSKFSSWNVSNKYYKHMEDLAEKKEDKATEITESPQPQSKEKYTMHRYLF